MLFPQLQKEEPKSGKYKKKKKDLLYICMCVCVCVCVCINKYRSRGSSLIINRNDA